MSADPPPPSGSGSTPTPSPPMPSPAMPSPPSAAPPPPPPPYLLAPPGYVGYAPSHFGAVPLQRVGGLSKAMTVLVALAAVTPLIDLAVRSQFSDSAEKFLASARSQADKQEFNESTLGYVALTGMLPMLSLAAGIITMIWMYRVARNHRALQRGGTWGPGWGIGGWFAPPVLYIIPTLMLAELWKASDPKVPVGGQWRHNPTSPLVWIWWVLYGLVPLVLQFASIGNLLDQISNSEKALAEQITGGVGPDLALIAVTIAAAAAFTVFQRQLTARHRTLTGEVNR